MRICKEGWPFIVGCFIAATMLGELGNILHSSFIGLFCGIGFIATAFCAYFFRDPERTIPDSDRVLLSPADGKILDITEETDPMSQTKVKVVRIFLSVFDPHLQRSPIAGKVHHIRYRKGKFLDARDPQAAFENEQNRIEIVPAPSSSIQGNVVVTQVAGLIARRIVCWVKEGQDVRRGERIGLIRFGSQVDVMVPANMKLRVKVGDILEAGSSILADVQLKIQ